MGRSSSTALRHCVYIGPAERNFHLGRQQRKDGALSLIQRAKSFSFRLASPQHDLGRPGAPTMRRDSSTDSVVSPVKPEAVPNRCNDRLGALTMWRCGVQTHHPLFDIIPGLAARIETDRNHWASLPFRQSRRPFHPRPKTSDTQLDRLFEDFDLFGFGAFNTKPIRSLSARAQGMDAG